MHNHHGKNNQAMTRAGNGECGVWQVGLGWAGMPGLVSEIHNIHICMHPMGNQVVMNVAPDVIEIHQIQGKARRG